MSKDPLAVGAILGELMRSRGWEQRLQAARVHERWEAVGGSTVAAHCRPGRLHDGALDVPPDSAAGATPLSYLQGTLLDRLAGSCGPGLVRGVRIRTEDDR